MWGIGAAAVLAGAVMWVLLTHQQANAIADRDVVCIEGVQYFMIREYQKGFMAPVYDHTTLQVKTCPMTTIPTY